MKTDLSSFRRSSTFYAPKAFLVSVKSFNLKEIRTRYLKSKQRADGRVGSVERRALAQGGLVYVELEKGLISKYEIISFLTEPRGIDAAKDMIAVSSENTIHVISSNGIDRIDDPWFSYIHTVHFNHRHDADRLLVSSSGFDCIFEYNLTDFSRSWEWFAWEHGFQKGFNPQTGKEILLTRNVREAGSFRKKGMDYLFISDPEKQALPTAQRAAFINSVLYDHTRKNTLLATFFHEGSVYRINMADGSAEKILDGLKSPHGGRNYRDHYMATSTSAGELCFSNGDSISFAGLPGKPPELAGMEWLQNSAPFEDCIISIDANRNSFVLLDPLKRKYDMISYDPNWAIQDIASVGDPETRALVGGIKEIIGST